MQQSSPPYHHVDNWSHYTPVICIAHFYSVNIVCIGKEPLLFLGITIRVMGSKFSVLLLQRSQVSGIDSGDGIKVKNTSMIHVKNESKK